jgi:hypothetical protein
VRLGNYAKSRSPAGLAGLLIRRSTALAVEGALLSGLLTGLTLLLLSGLLVRILLTALLLLTGFLIGILVRVLVLRHFLLPSSRLVTPCPIIQRAERRLRSRRNEADAPFVTGTIRMGFEFLLANVRDEVMGRYLLLWLLGIPLPILVLIWLLGGLN